MNRRRCLAWSGWLLALATLPLPPLSQAQTADEAGLDLSYVVRQALDWHPSVQATLATIDATAGALAESRSERWPQLTLRGSLTQFQEPMIVAPLHAFDVNQRPRFDQTLVGGDLSFQYTLFDGGARGARIRRSAAEARVSEHEHDAVEMNLIAEVTGAYLRILTLYGIGEAQELQIRALETERARVDQLLATGNAARVDLLRVEAAVAQARAERTATATVLDRSERNLSRLTGLPVTRIRADSLRPIAPGDSAVLLDRDALVARAERENPMLAQARERVNAARSLERSAEAAWLPRLDVGAGYLGFGSADAGAVAEWQAGVRLSYAIFTGGRRRSAVGMARAQTALAEQRSRSVQLATTEQIDSLRNTYIEWQARVTAGSIVVQHLTEVARIEQLALAEGARTQSDYLRAEADLLRARAQLVEARHGATGALVALTRTVGDLSVGWIDRTLEAVP